MKQKMIYDNLPDLIKSVLLLSFGWLVGSSPGTLVSGGTTVKDYDILVENREKYQEVIKMLSVMGFKQSINSFGGCKFTGDVEIDIWCEELEAETITKIKGIHQVLKGRCKTANNFIWSKIKTEYLLP